MHRLSFSKRMSLKSETRTTCVDGDELEHWLSTSLTSTEAVSAWVNPENNDSLYCNIAQYVESELIFFWLSSIRAIANLAQTNPYVLFFCACVLPQVLLHFSGLLPVSTCPPTLLPFPDQLGNTHIYMRKWYNTISFYNPEIKNRPSADDYLSVFVSSIHTGFFLFFFPSWVWLTSVTGAGLYTSLSDDCKIALFPQIPEIALQQVRYQEGKRVEKKKITCQTNPRNEGSLMASCGPHGTSHLTWACGGNGFRGIFWKESWKERNCGSAEVTFTDSEICIPDKSFAPIQLRSRARGLLKSTLLGCYRNLMTFKSPSLCETHDNADKANLTALTWRSQQTRWYYHKSTGNASLTKTWVWTIAFTLLVLLPRRPAWRNNNLVTQTSQVYIDTAMESEASSRKQSDDFDQIWHVYRDVSSVIPVDVSEHNSSSQASW